MVRGLKLVQGVGINDADYPVTSVNKSSGKRIRCPFYSKWDSMLTRCYSKKFQERRPSYKGCCVCEEWLTFSNFKRWMEVQDWRGKQLDKDLLVDGNKIYSPETCVFVTTEINNFIGYKDIDKSCYLTGVDYIEVSSKYRSCCSNPLTRKRENLGYFETEVEAHLAWKSRKLELVELLQEQGLITDNRVYGALKLKYS